MSRRAKDNARQFKRTGLRIERLEERAMMTAVPGYSSLAGAAKTLYLDFDGDFQAVWNRTDAGQTYYNIASGEYNKDGVAGFNSSELADIKEIWQEVADDYSPFNINVTTVEPPASAFTTNQAMRVVIAGNQTAQLWDPHFTGFFNFQLYDNISGNRFITDDNGKTLKDTSGYSSIGSFTDSEPNVAFVFAAYTNTWGSTDPQGHTRNYAQLIANTAAHEAGHTFGLVHHQGKDASGNASQYDVGDFLTTPIMGDNTESDRTIWSKNSTQDTVQKLTSVLGARADDYADYWIGAQNLVLSPGPGPLGHYFTSTTTSGVIGTPTDADFFHVTSTGGAYNFNANPIANGDLDAKLDVYKPVYIPSLGFTLLSLVGESDPSISSTQPFNGTSASLALNLASGDYYVAVRSHGNYGDLGMYTLSVSHNTLNLNPNLPVLVAQTIPIGPDPGLQFTTSAFATTNVGRLAFSGGAGQSGGPALAGTKASDLAFAAWDAPAANLSLANVNKLSTPSPVDEFELPAQPALNASALHRAVDLAFAARA